MDYRAYFKGKKVTVMSLGLLGRAVGDARFLAECGAELIVTDLKTEAELKTSVAELRSFPNVTFHLGGHHLDDFRNRDFVLKGAGIPIESKYLDEARKCGVPIEMSTSLFAKLSPATLVGITGTRGKSTVTHALYEILRHTFEDARTEDGRRIFLGGNVRGVSTLPLLSETKAGDIAVLELDSWQLQGFGAARLSPKLAIFTTFLSDHLNYYKGDLDRYLDDKANIFKFQKPDDTLLLGKQTAQLVQEKYPNIRSRIRIIDESVIESWQIAIPGDHNRYNLALAVEGAKVLGIPETKIREALAAFRGVPGRLEFVRQIDGLTVYNDTTATTPDATTAALKALSKNKNIILIMGGADKGIDMGKLIEMLPVYCKEIVVLPGTGTDRIRKDLDQIGIRTAFVSSMEEAVLEARTKSTTGDVILLSPSFASFGLFSNEFDRGDQFVKLIRNL